MRFTRVRASRARSGCAGTAHGCCLKWNISARHVRRCSSPAPSPVANCVSFSTHRCTITFTARSSLLRLMQRVHPSFISAPLPLTSSAHSRWLSTSSPASSQLPRPSSTRVSKFSPPKMISLTRQTANGEVKRVVVTGTGVVSCFGCDSDIFYNNLLQGKSGVKRVSTFDTEGWSTNFAAQIDNDQIQTEGYVPPKLLRRLDPFLVYALVASKKALEDAGIKPGSEQHDAIDKIRAGVLCGSGMGGLKIYAEGVEKLLTRGHNRMSPFFIPYAITNMVRTFLIPLFHSHKHPPSPDP